MLKKVVIDFKRYLKGINHRQYVGLFWILIQINQQKKFLNQYEKLGTY